MKTYGLVLLVVTVAGTGCVSQGQFLDGKQGMAMQTAVSRGQFEMNCPNAMGSPDEGDGCFATGPGRFVRD